MKKYSCVVLGATGYVGQQFVRMLAEHPRFELVHLFASSRSTGKTMVEIWNLPNYGPPESFANMQIENLETLFSHINSFDIAFSALPTEIAKTLESKLRKEGIKVFSNAAAYRMDDEVPILIPETNGSHAAMVKKQQEKYETEGFIVTNANCSITGASMYLGELQKIIPIENVIISTYQALSGAGVKGVSSEIARNNVIPFIQNEEEKMQLEGNKILGTYDDGIFTLSKINILANCARVPVVDGHLEAITIISENEINQEEVQKKINKISSPLFQSNQYYLAPENHFVVFKENNRPQPRIDAYYGTQPQHQGMSTLVGRIRYSQNIMSAFVLVHNTIRGGAGGSLLNAEYVLNNY